MSGCVFRRLQARPLYYGALAFSTLVANYSRWVSSTLSAVALAEQRQNESESGSGSWSGSGSSRRGGPVVEEVANVAQHAAVDEHGRLKVLLIGKELTAGAVLPFSVRVIGGASRFEHQGGVAVARMMPNEAKGAMSKYGDHITFAGQTWDGSSDGGPVGVRLVESADAQVAPGGKDLVVNVQVGRVSAVLLTFEPLLR